MSNNEQQSSRKHKRADDASSGAATVRKERSGANLDLPSERVDARRTVTDRFNRIAGRYDQLNRLLSLGTDLLWRRLALSRSGLKDGEQWLDLAAGSGDVAATGLRMAPGSRWIALDPTEGLLRRAALRQDLPKVPLLLGSAEELPLADSSRDGVAVAFGLRNFADPKRGLMEIHRVLRPGGRLCLLEFHPQPGQWGSSLVRFYLERLLPAVGGLLSGDREAYRYLASSSRSFWSAAQLTAELKAIDLPVQEQRSWMLGAVTFTLARRSS